MNKVIFIVTMFILQTLINVEIVLLLADSHVEEYAVRASVRPEGKCQRIRCKLQFFAHES